MLSKILNAVMLVCFAVCTTTTLRAQQPGPNAAMAKEILRLVNEHRAEKRLKPLVMYDVISKEAETHSRNMATHKVPFSHEGFDDRAARLQKKMKGVNAWAENVAFGTKTAREAVDMWLNSPGHKKNIEGPYNSTGLGIASGADGSLYLTQIFINQKE